MADYEVIPRRTAVRMGPLPPGIVAMVDSWRGAGFCFANENPLKMFKGSCLFCRNLELHSVIIIEVARSRSRTRRSPSPLMTMGEHGDRRSRSTTRNGSGKRALSTTLSTSPSRSRSSSASAVDLSSD